MYISRRIEILVNAVNDVVRESSQLYHPEVSQAAYKVLTSLRELSHKLSTKKEFYITSIRESLIGDLTKTLSSSEESKLLREYGAMFPQLLADIFLGPPYKPDSAVAMFLHHQYIQSESTMLNSSISMMDVLRPFASAYIKTYSEKDKVDSYKVMDELDLDISKAGFHMCNSCVFPLDKSQFGAKLPATIYFNNILRNLQNAEPKLAQEDSKENNAFRVFESKLRDLANNKYLTQIVEDNLIDKFEDVFLYALSNLSVEALSRGNYRKWALICLAKVLITPVNSRQEGLTYAHAYERFLLAIEGKTPSLEESQIILEEGYLDIAQTLV